MYFFFMVKMGLHTMEKCLLSVSKEGRKGPVTQQRYKDTLGIDLAGVQLPGTLGKELSMVTLTCMCAQ